MIHAAILSKPGAHSGRRPRAGACDHAGRTHCRVLGLDPGSQRTGYGIIDCDGSGERHVASGCIMCTGRACAVRLQRIYRRVHRLVAEHRPAWIAIERVFVHRNPDSALKLGQARGVALVRRGVARCQRA